MITNQRYKIILKEIEKNKSVTVKELMEKLNASESTIRRDLVHLDNVGKIQRVHGGALTISSINMTYEDRLEERQLSHVKEKDTIGQYAAQLIKPHDVVYIDAGSSTLRMLSYVKEKEATYVTNGILQAQILMQNGFQVQMPGGYIRNITGALVGAKAMDSLRKYNFTKGFFGSNGIDVKHGLTTANYEEAALKELAITQTQDAYILASHDKFHKIMPVQFASIEDVIIITDVCDDEIFKQHTTILEVK